MISEFVALRCDCGGEVFAPVVRLKYKPEGGTIPEPFGHWCVACHNVADNARMAKLIDMDRKRRQIKELQADVDAATQPESPVKVAATK